MADSDEMPEKLGKYEIKGALGKGAMGIVYEGFDPLIERTVALKTVLRSRLEESEAEQMLERFKREAQAAGRLTHPNIVSVYEYGEDGDTAYMAMEFVKGRELKDYFEEEQRFEIDAIVNLMTQLLEALTFSHKNGVVHRDIKPANIIVMEDWQVKVADFGIARLESSNLTQAGTVMGTPSYMSPEQFMGQRVDGRSDLYSAGVILYQFLTGEKPFTGAVTTIMHKVLNVDPEKPSDLNVQISSPFDQVVMKAIAKKPDERFQGAEEFLQAIVSASKGEPLPASMVDEEDATLIAEDATLVATDLPKAGGAAQPEVSQAGETDGAGSSNKIYMLGGGAALLLIAAGIFFFTTQSDKEELLPPPSAHTDSPAAVTPVPPTQQPVPPVAEPVPVEPKQLPQTRPEPIEPQPVAEPQPQTVIEPQPVIEPAAEIIVPETPAFIPAEPVEEKPAMPSAMVSVVSEPAGAVILINGDQFMGTSPARFELPEGVHEISLRKEGYYNLEAELEIEEDDDIDFDVELTLKE